MYIHMDTYMMLRGRRGMLVLSSEFCLTSSEVWFSRGSLHVQQRGVRHCALLPRAPDRPLGWKGTPMLL